MLPGRSLEINFAFLKQQEQQNTMGWKWVVDAKAAE